MYTQLKNKCLALTLSTLLIGSASLMAAPKTGEGEISKYPIEVKVSPPIVAGSANNIYFYQINYIREFQNAEITLSVNENRFPPNVTRLNPTPEEVKNVNDSATACLFSTDPHGPSNFKPGQSCILKFSFDAKNLVAGDKIRADLTKIGVNVRRKSEHKESSLDLAFPLSDEKPIIVE